MRLRDPLVEHGFTYTVLLELGHLKPGDTVRVVEAEYHHAPHTDDGGYILRFSNGEYVALDHVSDSDIIEHIGRYLRKGEAFEWSEGMAEYGAAFRLGMEEYRDAVRDETAETNRAASAAVEALVRQGLSPREAYQQFLKNGSKG